MATAGIPADADQLSWLQAEALAVQLADLVLAGGREFDKVLILQRGGAFVGDVVARRLGKQAKDVLSASITSYARNSTARSDHFEVGQFPIRKHVAGLHVLVMDEVCDTGRTLPHTTNLLQQLGVASAATAVLHYKPSKSETGYAPDYHVVETSNWIVYPWELHDAVAAPDPHTA